MRDIAPFLIIDVRDLRGLSMALKRHDILVAMVVAAMAPSAHAISFWDSVPMTHTSHLQPPYGPGEEGVGYVYSTAGACSGTLISARLVLTAAHCFDRDENGVVDTARANFWLTYPGQPSASGNASVLSGNVIANPQFGKNQSGTHHDLALIALDSAPSALFPRYKVYSGSLDARVLSNEGRFAEIVGYGRHYEEGVLVAPGAVPERHSGLTSIDLWSNTRGGVLGAYMDVNQPITNKGDSGGPLFIDVENSFLGLVDEYVVAGVASYGYNWTGSSTYAALGDAAYWTYVGNYTDFIAETAADLGEAVLFARKNFNKICPPGVICKPGDDFLDPIDTPLPDVLNVLGADAVGAQVPEPSGLALSAIAILCLALSVSRRAK